MRAFRASCSPERQVPRRIRKIPIHHHAWFVGYAPAGDPKIVVAVMIEFGGHGTRAARIASKIIQSYLHVEPTTFINTDG